MNHARRVAATLGCVAAIALGGCAGGASSATSPAAVIALWPRSIDRLDLVQGAPGYVKAIEASVPAARSVDLRRLTVHGGVLGTAKAPDVVVLTRGGGYRAAQLTQLRRTVLGVVVQHAGESYAYTDQPFSLAGDAVGGYVTADHTTGTWCAFVAHGMAVVVLASRLTAAQDAKLAADLQK